MITLVENPEEVLSECARVVTAQRSNYSGQSSLLRARHAAAIERLLAQKARKLGLRPEFPFQRLVTGAHAHGGAELIERRKIKPFGVYTLVRFRRAPRTMLPRKFKSMKIGKRRCHKIEKDSRYRLRMITESGSLQS